MTETTLRRRPAQLPDFPAIASLISQSWNRHGPQSEMHIGDLNWAYYSRPTTWSKLAAYVWQTSGGALRAFSMVSAGGWCDLVVHPDEEPSVVVEDLLRSTYSQNINRAMKLDQLRIGRRIRDPRIESMLQANGFHRMTFGFPTLQCSLPKNGPLVVPREPDGFRVASVDQISPTIEARCIAWNSAFPKEPRDANAIQRLSHAPGYRDDLDIHCITGDGIVAAFCTIWYDEATRSGLLEPVGTHAEYRRRGLATSITKFGLARLVSIGADHAFVRVDSRNKGAYAYYRNIGFETAAHEFGFEKPLRD